MSQPEWYPWPEQETKIYTLRIRPGAHRLAKIGAVTEGQTIGRWLEQAILEKIERDKEE
jgi:predicted HicB family RNase H-like nuclease